MLTTSDASSSTCPDGTLVGVFVGSKFVGPLDETEARLLARTSIFSHMAFLLPTNPSDMQHIQWSAREQGHGLLSLNSSYSKAKPNEVLKNLNPRQTFRGKKPMRKLARLHRGKSRRLVLASRRRSRVGIAKLSPRSQDLAPMSRVICIGPMLLPKKSTPPIAFQMDPNGTLNNKQGSC